MLDYIIIIIYLLLFLYYYYKSVVQYRDILGGSAFSGVGADTEQEAMSCA